MMNTSRMESLKKAAAAHRDNIRKSIQHRLEVARSQGNEHLIRLLEAEANYFN